jgi:hypothetical protein
MSQLGNVPLILLLAAFGIVIIIMIGFALKDSHRQRVKKLRELEEDTLEAFYKRHHKRGID